VAAVTQSDHGYAIPGGQQVITALIADADTGFGLDSGFVSGVVVAGTDAGSGRDGFVLVLVLADIGFAAEAQAVPERALDIGDFDVGHGLDGLLAEWGTSWGAIDLDMQATATRLHQRADGEAVLVLLAEES
jgi:hypothetical protein